MQSSRSLLINKLEKIIAISVVLLPLIKVGYYFEAGKIVAFLIISAFSSLYLLVSRNLKFSYGRLLFAVWILLLLFSSIKGINFIEALRGGSYRHQGVIFFLGLFIFGVAYSYFSEKNLKFIYKYLKWVTIIESVWILLEFIYSGLGDRPLGSFGEPNATAGFLSICFYLHQRQLKKIDIKLFSLSFIAVILTQSRTGIFCLTVLIFPWLADFIYMRLKTILNARNLNIGHLFVFLAAIMLVYTIISKGFMHRSGAKFENRNLLWSIGVNKILERPQGWGAESTEAIYNVAFDKLEMPLYDFVFDRSHNIFIDIGIWSGVAGLFIFVFWLFVQARSIFIDRGVRELSGLAGWIIFASFQPLSAGHWLMLILILRGIG